MEGLDANESQKSAMIVSELNAFRGWREWVSAVETAVVETCLPLCNLERTRMVSIGRGIRSACRIRVGAQLMTLSMHVPSFRAGR